MYKKLKRKKNRKKEKGKIHIERGTYLCGENTCREIFG
jgi:hypothetical protein